MLQEIGYCHGIENYSRHLDRPRAGRAAADPARLLPDDCLLVVDESHVTVPQVGGMYQGDRRARRRWSSTASGCRRRSTTGRCASRSSRSVRPDDLRLGDARALRAGALGGVVVEQVIRPTGLLDPRSRCARRRPGRRPARRDPRARRSGERVLVTTLTKRMAEDLTDYCRSSASGCATCTPTSTRSSGSRSSATCGWASSTCWSASTCCAKASTCPRCPSWRSSTPTRKASCAPAAH